jgi:hypothetical protein
MRHVFSALVAAVLAVGGIPASGAVRGEMTEPPIPCLDTTGGSTMWIQLAGDDTSQPQQVFGRFTSWDPQTTTIGFKSALSQEMEQIPIRSVRFEPRKPNPAAQVAMPILVPLGVISRGYPASEFSVVEGVLKVPGCSLKYDDKQLAFEGSLTFSAGDVRIEGTVFEVVPPKGGSGDSTGPKGG